MRTLERVFEAILWNSRFLTIVAVVASLVASLGMLYVASVDTIHLVQSLAGYYDANASAHRAVHGAIVVSVAEIIDGYLFALILMIFALGIYELFISKIEAAERDGVGARVLLIRSVDDLKVVFLILVVRYFEYALEQTPDSPIALLELAAGIALIAGALYLTSRTDER
jgi:uncharacterized membrane protein YqhA